MFDILLRVSMGESWQSAILGVLPSRKGAVAKERDSASEDEKVDEDDVAKSNIGDCIEKAIIGTNCSEEKYKN